MDNVRQLPPERQRPPADTLQSKRRFYWASELADQPEPAPLVKRFLDQGAMSVCYGEPNTGKSFFAFDLACHIALGRVWRDRSVAQGAVAYLALEGSLKRRLEAFCSHHSLQVEQLPLAVWTDAADLRQSDGDVRAMIEALKALARDEPFRLIIVDTLSRAMAGGNENAPDDMGAFIANCDRLRNETGAHVMIVHHSGKNTAMGARGHSSLRGATDTEIEVTHDPDSGLRCARVCKQRDGETGDQVPFRLEQVTLGEDEDGDPITSCVVIPSDDLPQIKTSLSARNRDALTKLHDLLYDQGEPANDTKHYPANVQVVDEGRWKEEVLACGIIPSTHSNPYQAWTRIVDTLRSAKLIGIYDGRVWAND